MDIQVTITAKLKDTNWGFSDLLNGRSLKDKTKKEIKELIMEDTTEVIEKGVWEIREVLDNHVNPKLIEAAIRETLVIQNKQSIHLAVNKIMKILTK